MPQQCSNFSLIYTILFTTTRKLYRVFSARTSHLTYGLDTFEKLQTRRTQSKALLGRLGTHVRVIPLFTSFHVRLVCHTQFTAGNISLARFCLIYGMIGGRAVIDESHEAIPFVNTLSSYAYYCFLLPLLILPTSLAMYINWYSMQTFEHN